MHLSQLLMHQGVVLGCGRSRRERSNFLGQNFDFG